MDVKTAAKAWVAATVALVGAYVTAKWGFEVPMDSQGWIVAAVWSAVSGGLTWLVPNKT